MLLDDLSPGERRSIKQQAAQISRAAAQADGRSMDKLAAAIRKGHEIRSKSKLGIRKKMMSVKKSPTKSNPKK